MRRLACAVSLFAILLAVSNSAAQQTSSSPVPNLISYSGTLPQTTSPASLSRIVGVTFAIYKQSEGGAPVWLETQNVTPDASGRYSVLLGNTRAEGLPADIFSAQEERWLGVQVQGQAEQPRVMLVSVPYAMKAAEADKLSGHSASEFVTTDTLQSAVKDQLQQQSQATPTVRTTALGVSPNLASDPYIANGTTVQTGANFNIDGNGSAATLNATSVYKLGGVAMLGNTGSQGLFLGAGAGQNNTGNYNLFLGAAAGQSNTTANYNTFIGYSAGKSNTTGTPVTFIGMNAGYHNTTGNQNFFLGVNAGYYNTTGFNDVFIGNSTGYKNTTGGRNTMIGIGAGYANATGNDNSFMGVNAGGNSTASSNTFLGAWSGFADTTGGSNTFVGMNAGKPVTTGSSNTFLGVNAGLSAGTAASNDVYIASQGASADSGVIRIGSTTSQTSAYIAGIYGNAPTGALPVVVNANGQMGTTTAGIGVSSFNARTGAVLPAANDYSFSQIGGLLAGTQLSGTYSNAVTLSNTTNVYFGNGSNLTGVVAGAGSPYYVQNGTALQTANFNISGSGIARGSLSGNTVNTNTNYQLAGSVLLNGQAWSDDFPYAGNLGVGLGASFGNAPTAWGNTAVGALALGNNSTGSENTALGVKALWSNSTGYANTATGSFALWNNTTGYGNTALGEQTLASNTSGAQNVAIGDSALATNTQGSENISIGATSMYSNTTGSNNTVVGVNAMRNNTGGISNVAIGGGALINNTTGFGNVAIDGAGALADNTTGNDNIAIGGAALAYNQTGAYNIAIGYHSGPDQNSTNLTNTIAIGVGAVVSQSNALVLGGSGLSAVKVGIGTPTPQATLDVVGSVNISGNLSVSGSGLVTSFNGRTGAVVPAANDYNFSQLSGTLGSSQLSGAYTNPLTLNNGSNSFSGSFTGNGIGLTGVLPAGGSANYIQNGTALQTANFNISGNGSANSFNSATNYGIGGSSVFSIGSPADSNLFLGVAAGANNIAGQGAVNTFVGAGAGESNTTGASNTFVGTNAGLNNTTGIVNTFVGRDAGLSNTSGQQNTFVGSSAGQNNTGDGNSFFGNGAGWENSTGNQNTFYGNGAGAGNTTGNYNTIVGSQGGGQYLTGHYNTFVGYQAGVLNTNGTSNIFIGGEGGVYNTTGSNNIYVGNLGVYQGTESSTIRIGFPYATSGCGVFPAPCGQNATYIAGVYGANIGSGATMFINSNGQLGTSTSSRRFKEQIRDMGDRTDALMKLRPVTFLYKPEYDKGPRTLQYGLIAEEVAEVYPDLVAYEPDGKPYTVKYQYLTTMLLNEMQKQYHRAEAQAEMINTQQQEIDGLKAQLQLQNATFQERLSRLESLVRTQMQTAADKSPQAVPTANGGLQ